MILLKGMRPDVRRDETSEAEVVCSRRALNNSTFGTTNGKRGSDLETGLDLRSDESPEGGIP
jgi:hypothetical protein